MLALPLVISVALLPLAAGSLITYDIAAVIACLFYGAPLLDGFSRGCVYFLSRPNPYIDLYEDPRSRHWVLPTTT